MAATAWDVELGSGVCRRTVLDGEHRSLLVSWVRSGQWLEGMAARRRLHLKLLRRGPMRALVAEHTMVPPATLTPEQAEPDPVRNDERGAGGFLFGGRRGGGKRKKHRGGRDGNGGERGPDGDGDASSSRVLEHSGPPPPVPVGDGALVAIAVRGGRVGARLWLDETTWLPHRMEIASPEAGAHTRPLFSST